MGDVDGSGAGLAVDLGDLGAHGDTLLGVKVGQRLVHEEDAHLADQRAADGDTLTLAAGERSRQTVQIVGQAEDAGGVAHLLVDIVIVRALELQAEGDVVIDAHLGIERIALEDHRHAALTRALLVGALAVDQEFTVADVLKTGDHTQRRRFAAAGGADEDDKFTLLHVEIEIVYRVVAVRVDLVDVFQR